jgi:hypothetical protein
MDLRRLLLPRPLVPKLVHDDPQTRKQPGSLLHRMHAAEKTSDRPASLVFAPVPVVANGHALKRIVTAAAVRGVRVDSATSALLGVRVRERSNAGVALAGTMDLALASPEDA